VTEHTPDLVADPRYAHLADRIWRRDPAAFVGTGADVSVYAAIRNRFGWLDAPGGALTHVDTLAEFAAEVRADGLTDVILLGMGGSSLCAEVLRDVPGRAAEGCHLTVLDTTDERAIRATTESIDPARTLFLVASKSGTTTEVSSLEHYFWKVMSEARGSEAGRHFVAITDPGTTLETEAGERHYRRTFINPPDIGGRYSALSLFGLVPAALLGWKLPALIESAAAMATLCHAEGAANPGLALGAFMAANARIGRDKLTVLLPPDLAPFGAWVEQLVAESTGKLGQGVLPVVGEPFGAAKDYASDRAFVAVTGANGVDVARLARDLERAGHPVFTLAASAPDLGGEFFRWEFATAVAGAMLGINPFDEPNVKEAKTRTQAQLDARATTGAFRLDPPYERGSGYLRRESRPETAADSERRRYVALLDFLPADAARSVLFDKFRAEIRHRLGLACTHGVGPRYLHSTGQFHKGGPNSGLFVLLTAADASATPVPGAAYTFSALKQAQALGDFDALVANGRHVIHYHLDDPTADFSVTLQKLIDGIRNS
jgi:transaldolase/glucose-6-phosphate isomerase